MTSYEDFIIDPIELKTNLSIDNNIKDISIERFCYSNKEDKLVPFSYNLKRYNYLLELKDIYSNKDIKLITHLYPYEYVNNSIFNNRAALKLANLDYIFNITKFKRDYFDPKSDENKRPIVADLCFAPGGFSQYIQYRFDDCYIFGITYKEGLNWNSKDLDMNRFENVTGNSGTGNLYIDYKDFIKKVGLIDLVIADGGTDVINKTKEIESSKLILCEIMIGISCTKVDCDFIVKVFDTVTKTSADIIYLLSLYFEKVYIFKPIMSRSTNGEKYIVCKRRNKYNDPDIKRKIEDIIDNDRDIIIFDSLPLSYIEWFTEINNFYTEKQIYFAEKITMIYNKKYVKKIKANLHKVLIELYLPGERSKYNKSIIKRNFKK